MLTIQVSIVVARLEICLDLPWVPRYGGRDVHIGLVMVGVMGLMD